MGSAGEDDVSIDTGSEAGTETRGAAARPASGIIAVSRRELMVKRRRL
jgi:hypothetical protein